MVKYSSCLKNVIGLSQADCDCTELVTANADYKKSDSGLYIDDLEYGIRLNDINLKRDCSPGSVWDLMNKARSQAIDEFQTVFLGEVQDAQKERLYKFKGNVGDYSKAANYLVPDNTIQGTKYSPYAYRGATWTIKKMGLWTNAPDDTVFTVSIVSTDPTQTFDDIDVTVKNNKLIMQTLDTPLELPMTDAMGTRILYWFLWDRQGYLMKDIKWHCGCTGSQPPWKQYMEAAGFQTNDVATYDVTAASQYTNGLVLDSMFTCYGTDFICSIDDWSDPYAQVVATTIQLLAIRKLISFILNSERVGFYTLVKAEELHTRVTKLNDDIKWRMKWLAKKIPVSESDCLVCRDASKITKKELIV